jgi:hypothetical protein
MAGAFVVKGVAQHLEATAVCEICMMPLSVKEVDFLSACFGIEHSILSKMVSWAFPFEVVSRKAVGVLLSGGLLFLRDKENYFVVVARSNYASRDGVETCVSPQLGQGLAGVCGALFDLCK